MKQGGAFLAIILAISGILHVAGPATANPRRDAKSETTTSKSASTSATNRYQDNLNRTIQRFCKPFGNYSDAPAATTSIENPFDDCQNPKFVIAILPDPIHTHLALHFDRAIEAIQQAGRRQGYTFDTAILPWGRAPAPTDSDAKNRNDAVEEQRFREARPGVLIFRPPHSESSSAAAPASEQPDQTTTGALFVLVVGETPTGGVNREQLHNALFSIDSKWGQPGLYRSSPLLIMGPSFSGSLDSLHAELRAAAATFKPLRAFIYSGTVTASRSIKKFQDELNTRPNPLDAHFASFQENDSYILDRFIRFVRAQRYELGDVAVLSEDETVYGEQGKPSPSDENMGEDVTLLHFPREISYFRSEYQKENVGQNSTNATAPARTTLTLDLSETGTESDSVQLYAGSQTPVSQEAVMLGIITELQKHHTEFTFLFATDPLDELFLARYLRNGYPQGRVVVSTPDLLFVREQDPLLRGVLSLSTYALVPGLNDKLCQQPDTAPSHEDRLFVSASSIGTYNAMLGLLSIAKSNSPSAHDATSAFASADIVPQAPYEEYSSPIPSRSLLGSESCDSKPYVWLSVLGRDGFWPMVSLRPPRGQGLSTLKSSAWVFKDPPETPDKSADKAADKSANATPPAWKIAYCICMLMMFLHAYFTCTASTLSPVEASAQFAAARTEPENWIIAIGALALSSSMLILLCARSPIVRWKESWVWTVLLWVPIFVFVGFIFWAFNSLRSQGKVAMGFVWSVASVGIFLLLLSRDAFVGIHMYWPSRLVNLDSGVSPILPVLLLLGAAYWWTWQSLRGIALVDQRRPRLPSCPDLAKGKMHLDAYHISDVEGDQLRTTAHPCCFQWQILIPVFVLFAVSLTVLDLRHPIQTVEGFPYDLSYSVLLFLMVAGFLACLLRLVRTWSDCRLILGGLDRLPLRRAFARMKRLSWHSMWNPGGSTLRETYKLMSRALENANRLKKLLPPPPPDTVPLPRPGTLESSFVELNETLNQADGLYGQYLAIVKNSASGESLTDACFDPSARKEPWRVRHHRERINMPLLEDGIETLQQQMARSAASLLAHELKKCWSKDLSPSVSDPKGICPKSDNADKDNSADKNKIAGKGDQLKDEKEGAVAAFSDFSDDCDEGLNEDGKDLKDGNEKPSDDDKEAHADEKKDDEKSEAADDEPAYKCLPLIRVLAEEYVALIYVNFLGSVLLRLRTMVIAAAGMYVFIVLSINTYPFEPHLALQSMAVVMLVVMGVAVGTVYAQMHRDNILSRLTSSKPGELGWDFWLKLVSAGAIPVFSLLASQFPSIRQFLFSWLEPALQAVK
jgi:hypothetical protein